jgi:hypothetical protein
MSIATQPAPPKAATRGWFSRNWKWFVPATFALLAALTAITVFAYVQVRLYRYRSHPAYEMALATVQESERVQARLGEPIEQSGWFPQQQGEGRELTFNFTVVGTKETAAVAAQASLIDGEWAVNSLRVRFPNDEQINLTQGVLARQKIDTPVFDPTKEPKNEPESKEAQPESTDLNVQVPDLPPGLK